MSEIVTRINTAYEKLWSGRPAEIGAIFERNKENGKHFSVWVNAYVSAETLCSQIFSLTGFAGSREGDFDTVKMFGASALKSGADMFRVSYGMTEYADLLAETAQAVREAGSWEKLNEIARAIHLYCVRMWYYIDGVLPWAEMSAFFNETRRSAAHV